MFSSPCLNCYTHGFVYSEESCKNCDYYKAIRLLKRVLLVQDGCYVHCKNCLGYDKYQCPICPKEDNRECNDKKLYELDFDKIAKDYEIEL